METIRFYKEARRMQCLAGDTLPVFSIMTDAEDLTGCTMRLVLEALRTPGSAVLTKTCTRSDSADRLGYSVQLTTEDTAALSGHYRMHFVLTDANGYEQRKLIGNLEVLPVPEVV